tara:strand:- start:849 stop:1493 length:645 start_codon:yes stop_codon:yes gene_type:complete
MKEVINIAKRLVFLFYFSLSLIILQDSLNASGGYDNGTSVGKGNLGLDLTWNPFNYWKKGQSYAVISYGLSHSLDIHGYYSIPVEGSDNYYLGIFYQFYKNKYLDLATAIGVRQYLDEYDKHLFAPQLLFTLYITKEYRFAGSFVSLKNIKDNKSLGTTIDISLIFPLKYFEKDNSKLKNIDFCIGLFKPVLWKPDRLNWHPTYSINFIYKISK